MKNHQNANRDIFFFCNSNHRPIEFEATFPFNKTAWEWNAETGDKTVFAISDSPITIKLKRLQSLLLIFQDETGDISPRYEIDKEIPIEIEEPWQVDFYPVQSTPFEKRLTSLVNFKDDQSLQNFSGYAIYKTKFTTEKIENMILDLGEVFDIAEVKLNETLLGTGWWGDKQFFITEQIVKGANQLEIKVTTTLFNCMQSLEDNAVVKYWLQRRKNNGLVNAGLVGPVKLYKTRIVTS
jgi:hypothetical protein